MRPHTLWRRTERKVGLVFHSKFLGKITYKLEKDKEGNGISIIWQIFITRSHTNCRKTKRKIVLASNSRLPY